MKKLIYFSSLSYASAHAGAHGYVRASTHVALDARVHTCTAQPKAGIPNIKLFAPTWELVGGHKHFVSPDDARWAKYKPLTDEQYTVRFVALLNSRKADIDKWVAEINEAICLCCYCAHTNFCHRHIVKQWLAENYRNTFILRSLY